MHPPAPSHVDSAVKAEPAQDADLHAVVAPFLYAMHLVASVAPSQVVALHLSLPPSSQTGRGLTGSPVTGLHVPVLPVTLHAWHCALHGVSQQTESTQLPLLQSPGAEHRLPLSFRQIPLPFAHELPGLHAATAQHTLSVQKSALGQLPVVQGSPSPGSGTQVLPLQ